MPDVHGARKTLFMRKIGISRGIDQLQRRREWYLIMHMWKVLNDRCPNDLNIQFNDKDRHGIKPV